MLVNRFTVIALWGWVVMVLALYVHSLRDLLPAVLDIVLP